MIVPPWKRITAAVLAFLLSIALGAGAAYLIAGWLG